jgi:hypothetical protein
MAPVQFTPGQLRETVGISVETFRHWKRVLPPFARRKRYAPSFTVGDLLAGRVLRSLTEGCGVRVGHLTRVSSDIVRVCNTAPWTSLERAVLLIDLVSGTCRLSEQDDGAGDMVLRCAMRPMLLNVRDALLRSQPAAKQHSLLLPPVELRRERSARRRAS